LLVDQAADAAIGELRSQLSETLAENAKLRSHLDNQATKAGYEKAKAAAEEIERLQSQIRPAADPEAIALLQSAITPLSREATQPITPRG